MSLLYKPLWGNWSYTPPFDTNVSQYEFVGRPQRSALERSKIFAPHAVRLISELCYVMESQHLSTTTTVQIGREGKTEERFTRMRF